ncbi:MAG: aquaporin [Planctomycetota bacterium]
MSDAAPTTANKLAAECFGTFCLVLAGTGAIVINEVSGGAVSHAGVAIVFGLVVMAMINAFGDVSGAHINPAVTIAFWASGRFEGVRVPGYVIAQVTGALLASLLLKTMFYDHPNLGATLPIGAVWRSFVLEVALTWILMTVIFSVATGSKEKGLLAGITIGGVVGLEAMFAGPICGASMNPARSLAPAVVSGSTEHLWVYLVSTTIGALLAVPTAMLLYPSKNSA